MTQEQDGAPSGTGSREPDQQAVPALTGFDPSRKMFFNRSEVIGVLAMWAVRQSPYPVPERLEPALAAAYERLPDELEGWFWATEDELRDLVSDLCLNEPEIAKWNAPKSGHTASIVFSSRYDRPSPDDDFIDLYALAGNVCRTLIADQYDCDSDRSGEAGETPQDDSTVGESAGRTAASPEGDRYDRS